MQSLAAATTEETRSVVRSLKKMNISQSNNSLFCSICQVYVSSDSVMQTHVQGKRHIELEKLQKKQMSMAAKSVYVRGYPSGSTANQLAQFFGGFGKVARVVLEREHGYYAIVEFSNASTVKSLLSKPSILMNGSRLTIKSRQLRGVQLKSKNQPGEKRDKAASLDTSNDLLERLKQCSNMKDEMELLTKEFSLSSEDIVQRHNICQDLEKMLRKNLFSACSVLPFGSSVNGLGSKGCDLDLFLNLDSEGTLVGLPFTAKDLLWEVPDFWNRPCSSSNVSLSSDVISGNTSPKEREVSQAEQPTAGQSVLEVVRKISNLIRSRSETYSQVIRIASARCPVVRFVHVRSGLKCDLSINNRLALCNTVLIKFLLNFDDRIRPLIISLRHWAKLKEVAGQANTGSKLTNYALTMMIFYYLQSISPPVIPPIEELSRLAENPRIVDGWECAFTTDVSKISKTENDSTIEKLLTGFFEFFAHFDFNHKIICVRSGKSVDLASFSEKIASDSRLKYFKICPILIQDPFVLSHNVASNVNEKSRDAIQKSFLAAAHFFKDKSASGQSPRLHSLLSSEIVAQPNHELINSESGIHSETESNSGIKGSQRFTIKSDVVKLMEEVFQKEKMLNEVQNIWCRNAVTIVQETLKIFHMNYSLLDGKDCSSHNSTESDEHSSDCDPFEDSLSSESMTSEMEQRQDDGKGELVLGSLGALQDCNGDKAFLKDKGRHKRCLTENYCYTSQKRAKSASCENLSSESNGNSGLEKTTTGEEKTTDSSEECHVTNDSECMHGISLVFSAHCSSNSPCWVGRKKLRKQLSYISDDYEKEKEISRLIDLEREQSGTEGASLAFDIFVWVEKSPEAALTVALEPSDSERSKELTCFLFSFRSVLEKLVDKYALQDPERWKDQMKQAANANGSPEN